MVWQVSHENSGGGARARSRAPGMKSGEVEAFCGSANTMPRALGHFFLNLLESIFPSAKVSGENSVEVGKCLA